MLVETRRRRLLDLVNQRGFATLEDLASSLSVSESTIRRDLEALDQSGAIKRTHGGAVCLGELRAMPAHEDRAAAMREEKVAIGQAAAALVRDGDTVLLDGGTTTLEVARALLGRQVQLVTNSLPIAQIVAPYKDTDLILIGGYVYPRTGVAMGPIAIASLRDIRAHKVMMGAGGIVAEGIYNSNSMLVETEREMMRCGQEIFLLADHSKFGRLSLSWLCGLEEVHHLVVDPGLPAEYRQLFEESGVTVHLATMAESDGKGPSHGN